MFKIVILLLIFVCLLNKVHNICLECSSVSNAACISETQYFMCNANGEVDVSQLLTCDTGFCSEIVDICTENVANTLACSSPSVPVVNTNFNATTYCSTRSPGYYAYPSDLTCKNYVYCFLNNGMKGSNYTCLGSLLFNPTSRYCQQNYTCV